MREDQNILKPLSLPFLTNFCKEFSASLRLSTEMSPHTTASRVSAAGGKDDRVSAVLTWISLSHHEPAPFKNNAQAQRESRLKFSKKNLFIIYHKSWEQLLP